MPLCTVIIRSQRGIVYYCWNITFIFFFLVLRTFIRTSSTASVYRPCFVRLFFKSIRHRITQSYSSGFKYTWYFFSNIFSTSSWFNHISKFWIEKVWDFQKITHNTHPLLLAGKSMQKLSLAELWFSLAKSQFFC